MSMSASGIQGGDGNYLLIASGETRYAPYLADWRQFKDHIRKSVKEQPGWADIIPGKRAGELQGWCRLKDGEDAEAVYNACCRSRGVLVHVFATSVQSAYFNLVKCNCVAQFPGVGDSGHSPRRSCIDVGAINQTLASRCPATTPMYAAPAQSAYQQPNYYQTPSYAPSSAYSYPAPTMQYPAPLVPAYSQSSGGLPVNLGQGAVVTESRGIFIQGLNYNVGNSDLLSLIHSVGLRPLEAKVHKDSKGSSKGVGSAKFGTKEEAQYGVTVLNGKFHRNKTLTVRLDTESTVVGALPPLIVDGTNASRY